MPGQDSGWRQPTSAAGRISIRRANKQGGRSTGLQATAASLGQSRLVLSPLPGPERSLEERRAPAAAATLLAGGDVLRVLPLLREEPSRRSWMQNA